MARVERFLKTQRLLCHSVFAADYELEHFKSTQATLRTNPALAEWDAIGDDGGGFA